MALENNAMPHNRLVAGSSPAGPTTHWRAASRRSRRITAPSCRSRRTNLPGLSGSRAKASIVSCRSGAQTASSSLDADVSRSISTGCRLRRGVERSFTPWFGELSAHNRRLGAERLWIGVALCRGDHRGRSDSAGRPCAHSQRHAETPASPPRSWGANSVPMELEFAPVVVRVIAFSGEPVPTSPENALGAGAAVIWRHRRTRRSNRGGADRCGNARCVGCKSRTAGRGRNRRQPYGRARGFQPPPTNPADDTARACND